MPGKQFLFLSGTVKTTEGKLVTLKRGDPLPDNAEPADVERLEAMGAFGDAPAASPEPSLNVSSDSSEEELVAFVKEASPEQVVASAGDDVNFAERLLEAEIEGREDPRKDVVEALEEKIDNADSDPDPDGDGQDALDYSTMSKEELGELVLQREISVEEDASHEDLVAALVADDEADPDGDGQQD